MDIRYRPEVAKSTARIVQRKERTMKKRYLKLISVLLVSVIAICALPVTAAASVNAGADYAIGFEKSISCKGANAWTSYFSQF